MLRIINFQLQGKSHRDDRLGPNELVQAINSRFCLVIKHATNLQTITKLWLVYMIENTVLIGHHNRWLAFLERESSKSQKVLQVWFQILNVTP